MDFDEIKIYLPKYLSADSEKKLFSELKSYPNNIDQRIYTSYLKEKKIIFQGDGLKDLLIVNLPNTEIKKAPSIVLSNTCDIDSNNIRNFPSQIIYAPIVTIKKYRTSILENSSKTKEQILAHIDAIKKQHITQIFYLPKLEGVIEESIVFLDRVFNISNNFVDRNNLGNSRMFTLSDYGIYLFLFKLSIHFARIQDKVERRTA